MEIKNILFIAFLRALRKKLSERAIQTGQRENLIKYDKYIKHKKLKKYIINILLICKIC